VTSDQPWHKASTFAEATARQDGLAGEWKAKWGQI